MNDEIEEVKEVESGPQTIWVKFVKICEVWIPRIGVVAMIVMGVLTYFYGEEVPEGVHCATEKGNATCVERYGGDQPYCDRSSTIYHGCISRPPPPEHAASCGQLAKGLPGDPDCSKIVADNPPSDETLAKREQGELRDKIGKTVRIVLGLGFFVGVTIWIFGRGIIRDRARAAHRRRAAEVAATLDSKYNQTPPAARLGTESNEARGMPVSGHQSTSETKEG